MLILHFLLLSWITEIHNFAKDGFSYRTAYFEDFDGEYYKFTLSIGHNGEMATIYNVGKIEIFTTLEIIFAYTNINFTDKQKEDVCKLYDLFMSSDLMDEIFAHIPESELDWISDTVKDTIESIYSYQNSVMGILDSINQDYSNLNLDATEIQKKIADPENLELLKSIMTRLG